MLSRYVSAIVIRTFGQDRIEQLAVGRLGAGGQRADRLRPPVPGAGRPADDPRAQGRPVRARRWPTSATATTWRTRCCSPVPRPACAYASPRRPATSRSPRSSGGPTRSASARVARRSSPTTRSRRPTRCRHPLHRRLGVDGPGGGERHPAAACSSPTSSTSGRSPRPRTTSWSCTACRRTGARRSPAASSTAPHSAVWDQAENRLHVQKALLTFLVEHATPVAP